MVKTKKGYELLLEGKYFNLVVGIFLFYLATLRYGVEGIDLTFLAQILFGSLNILAHVRKK